MVYHKTYQIKTNQPQQVLDITPQVKEAVSESRIKQGLACVFIKHTTAGLAINHFEQLLTQDILLALSRLAPQNISYNHDLFEQAQGYESPNDKSNGHAHVKALLLKPSLNIPLSEGNLLLGDRQSVLLIECDGSRTREIVVTILGDVA